MIGSLFQGFFSCPHSRLTRPLTPIKKPGVPSGDTYVVCLDCGKQFFYDWNHMRIGKPIERSHDSGVLHPAMPGPAKARIKYALLGSAVPLAFLLGGALMSKRRAKGAEPKPAPQIADERLIDLPHGGPGAHFPVRGLIAYIQDSGRDYVIEGAIDCAFSDHPEPSSLDYWLRERFAKNKEIKQATPDVVRKLVATGLFEEVAELRCPDDGHRHKGLKLKSGVAPAASV